MLVCMTDVVTDDVANGTVGSLYEYITDSLVLCGYGCLA